MKEDTSKPQQERTVLKATSKFTLLRHDEGKGTFTVMQCPHVQHATGRHTRMHAPSPHPHACMRPALTRMHAPSPHLHGGHEQVHGVVVPPRNNGLHVETGVEEGGEPSEGHAEGREREGEEEVDEDQHAAHSCTQASSDSARHEQANGDAAGLTGSRAGGPSGRG